jgi:hypothetical protein
MGTSLRFWAWRVEAGLSAIHATRHAAGARRVTRILEESMWIKITELSV